MIGPRRLLFVDVKLPTPDRDAASQRSVQLLERLAARGFAIDFAAAFPVERSGAPSPAVPGMTTLPHADPDALREHLACHPGRYDVVVLCWTRVASRLIEPARAANPDAFILFDTNDVNHVREFRHGRVSGNARILRRALMTKQRELACVAVADCTLAVTETDARTLRAACPGARVEVATLLAPPLPPGRPERGFESGDRRGSLFLGNLQAAPNVDAALSLVEEILPELRRLGGDTAATIAGSEPPEVISRLAEAGDVRVTGYVDDLASLFDAHQVFVCPLRFGSGIKGKLLTAMAFGLPAVVTPIAAEGMELGDQREVLIGETPAELAHAILRLQREPELRRRLAGAAREHVLERHGSAVLDAQIRKVFSPR